jgi:nitrogen fixation/metabolism regulation signal transduction histidine kinase
LSRYRQEQNNMLLDRSEQIARGLESKLFYMDELKPGVVNVNLLADVNAVDLNLYDVSGKLLTTTQPRIFDYGIQADRINPTAFIYLARLKRAEYVNKEKAGKLSYLAAYKPIRNTKNKIIAFLSLPNYNYLKDADKQLNTFLNTLINIYALVLVTIGFFAVFVANKITYPLTLIQENLSKIKIGTKNEPIVWKRDDEIGRLIEEYNKMILALEDNAYKLARSERESAWREMAKQVAHEIKNPLTPLKLGVQLLEKSWKENDPNFSKKFEKFSKSFIEQIESLSNIASEFSNFAKMPDTTFTDVDLSEVISQSIQVFSKLNDLQIDFENRSGGRVIVKGDKDHLLKIFNNLLKNAVEAIPDYVEGHIKITLEERRGTAHLTITDNGKGIPENLRERIFHPNFTTKSSGTGLGLAFVKQAVENMMGSVSFKTTDNDGTSFFIDIPAAK